MAIERFIDEIGTNLNKFQVTTSSGDTYEITLLRKANISQVGTLLNATKLNELVDAINVNSAKQVFINGANNNTPNFYAPTSAGTNDQVLKSSGGTPTWINQSDLSVGSATNATNDANGNKISTTYVKKSEISSVALSGLYEDLDDKPSLSTVAKTGSYNDLSDKPTKVSQLENDAMYLKRSSKWEGGSVSDYILDSYGFYYVEVVNDQTFGNKRLVMGVIYYNGTEKYYITRYGSTNFALILLSNGEMRLRSYTSSSGYNTALQGYTWFHWIKLG